MTQAVNRLVFFDACRGLFMFQGILNHACLPFVIGGGWLMVAHEESTLLTALHQLMGSYLMPGFFIISGYLIALFLERKGGLAFSRVRMARLGLPLAFGVALIVPLDSLAIAFLAGLRTNLDALEVARMAAAQHLRFGFHLVSHLWFLLDLLILSLLVAMIHGWSGPHAFTRRAERAGRILAEARKRTLACVLLGLSIYLIVTKMAAASKIGELLSIGGNYRMWHILDAPRLAYYAPFIIFGILLYHKRELLMRYVRPSPGAFLGAGVSATILLLAPNLAFGRAFEALVAGPCAVFLTALWLQLAYGFLNRRSHLLDAMAEGSYAMYLVHHAFVLFSAAFVISRGIPALPAFAIVVLVTVTASALVYLASRGTILGELILGGRLPARGFWPGVTRPAFRSSGARSDHSMDGK